MVLRGAFIVALLALASPLAAEPVDFGVISPQRAQLFWEWNAAEMPELRAWVIVCNLASGESAVRTEVEIGRHPFRLVRLRRVLIKPPPGRYLCSVTAEPSKAQAAIITSNQVTFEIK